MNDESVRLFALSVLILAEIEGMKAENQYRLALGQQVAYCEDTFAVVAAPLSEALRG